MKKNVAFKRIYFTLLKWDECLSFQLPFELPIEIPVQLHVEMEVNWLVQSANELEFELSRMYVDEMNLWYTSWMFYEKKCESKSRV